MVTLPGKAASALRDMKQRFARVARQILRNGMGHLVAISMHDTNATLPAPRL